MRLAKTGLARWLHSSCDVSQLQFKLTQITVVAVANYVKIDVECSYAGKLVPCINAGKHHMSLWEGDCGHLTAKDLEDTLSQRMVPLTLPLTVCGKFKNAGRATIVQTSIRLELPPAFWDALNAVREFYNLEWHSHTKQGRALHVAV